MAIDSERGATLRAKTFAKWQATAKDLIVSDENILAECNDGFKQDELYPEIQKRLGLFQPLVAGYDDIRVLLVIRNLVDFLPAYYLEALRWAPDYKEFHELFGGRTHFSWMTVVGDIVATLPTARVLVVPYESYPAQLTEMLKFIGLKGLEPRISANQVIRRSPKRGSLMAFKVIRRLLPTSKRRGLFNRLSAQRLLSLGCFDPFSVPQKQRLSALYQDDLQALRLRGYLLSTGQLAQ